MWQNNYRVTWNGAEFVVLAEEGDFFPLYSNEPTWYVARFTRDAELIELRQRGEWSDSVATIPARSGYAAVSDAPAERTLHSSSGDVLEQTSYPGRVIDWVVVANGRFILLATGTEDQLWTIDDESRPLAQVASWPHDRHRALKFSYDALELFVILRRGDGVVEASRLSGGNVDPAVPIPSTAFSPVRDGFVAASVRGELAGDVGQVHVQSAAPLEQLSAAARRTVSMRARVQWPIAIASSGETIFAVWSEASTVMLQRMLRDGTHLDGGGVVIPMTGATDAAADGRGVLIVGAAQAAWIANGSSEVRVLALPEPLLPKMVVASDSGYLVYWTSEVTGASQVVAARVSSSGDLIDPSGFFVMPTGVKQHHPSIVSTGEGFLMLLAQYYSDVQELLLTVRLGGDGRAISAPVTVSSRVGVAYQSTALAFRDGVALAAWRATAIEPYPTPPGGVRGAWLDAHGVPLAGRAEEIGTELIAEVCCSSAEVSVVATPTRFLVGSLYSDSRWTSVPRTPDRRSEIATIGFGVTHAVGTSTGAAFLRHFSHNDFTFGVTTRVHVTIREDRQRPVRPR